MKLYNIVLSAALAVLSAGAALAESRVALVVGNSAYRHVDPLRKPGERRAGYDEDPARAWV